MRKLLELFNLCLNADYVHTENSGDYAIVKSKNQLILLFQWSNGSEDWENNFNFPAKAYKKGSDKWYCHRGFLKVWKSIRDELEPRVESILKANDTINSIICIGYSQGAAIAGLATEDMEFLYGDKKTVQGYGFGCPRFVFGFLPEAVKKRFEKFTPILNRRDIVTHVPPALLGFRHAGNIIRIGKGKHNSIDSHKSGMYIEAIKVMELEQADNLK